MTTAKEPTMRGERGWVWGSEYVMFCFVNQTTFCDRKRAPEEKYHSRLFKGNSGYYLIGKSLPAKGLVRAGDAGAHSEGAVEEKDTLSCPV